MIENLLGVSVGITLSDLGILATITSLIVEVLKQCIPKNFPTQALTIIVALIISIIALILFYGTILKAIGLGILTGFIVAYISMNGFDAAKNIWERFQKKTL